VQEEGQEAQRCQRRQEEVQEEEAPGLSSA
jgi:hypothetical protein